jgi:hypothetical protein
VLPAEVAPTSTGSPSGISSSVPSRRPLGGSIAVSSCGPPGCRRTGASALGHRRAARFFASVSTVIVDSGFAPLDDLHVLDVSRPRDRPVVQDAVLADRAGMEAVDRDLGRLERASGRGRPRTRCPARRPSDSNPSWPPRFCSLPRHVRTSREVPGAVRLVDQRERRDHAVAGPVVRGEHLQPAAERRHLMRR